MSSAIDPRVPARGCGGAVGRLKLAMRLEVILRGYRMRYGVLCRTAPQLFHWTCWRSLLQPPAFTFPALHAIFSSVDHAVRSGPMSPFLRPRSLVHSLLRRCFASRVDDHDPFKIMHLVLMWTNSISPTEKHAQSRLHSSVSCGIEFDGQRTKKAGKNGKTLSMDSSTSSC